MNSESENPHEDLFMYEKPQYLTPDGYRRSSKNPYKRKSVKKAPLKKGPIANKILTRKHFQHQAQRGISKEAAKLIAQAIKGMLHQ